MYRHIMAFHVNNTSLRMTVLMRANYMLNGKIPKKTPNKPKTTTTKIFA